MSTMIKHIYVEETIRDHPRTHSILKKFPATRVIECKHYGQIFNRHNQSFRIQKQQPSLILAEKKNKRILPVPPSLEVNQPSYYFSHMLNCVYDCRYCFLQGMFRSAHYVIFVNYEDFYDDIIKISDKNKRKTFFFSGYDCDSLALEPITEFTNNFLPLFKKLKQSTLELRTKSTQIRSLLETEVLTNIICSFSLNPNEIISQFEHKTPNLESRIRSIQKLSDAGWTIGLRFDPVVLTANFKKIYSRAFEQIFSSVQIDRIESITIGTFRVSADQIKKMLKDYPNEWLYHTVTPKSGNRIGYAHQTDKAIINWCKEQLSLHSESIPIYVQE